MTPDIPRLWRPNNFADSHLSQKKLDEIEEKGLKTIDEDEFLEMVKTGDAAKHPQDVDGVDDDEADEEEEDEEPAPKKTKKAAPKAKAAPKEKAASKGKASKAENEITVPEGKANAFKGLKLLFTGTFEIDRKTCEATAKTYGASCKFEAKSSPRLRHWLTFYLFVQWPRSSKMPTTSFSARSQDRRRWSKSRRTV